MSQITVSPLKIIYGTVTLLYGKNGDGKSMVLKNFGGFFKRRNEQKLKVSMKPGYVFKEEYIDDYLYGAYFNASLPLRMEKRLTVREYTKYYIQCLKCNDKFETCWDNWIYPNEELVNNDFYQGILDEEIQNLSDGGKTFIQLFLFIMCNRFTPIWLLDEPFITLHRDLVMVFCNFLKYVNLTFNTTIVITTHHYPSCLMDIIDYVSYIENRNILGLYSKNEWYTQLSLHLDDVIDDDVIDRNIDLIINYSSELEFDEFYQDYAVLKLGYIDNFNENFNEDFGPIKVDSFNWKHYFKLVYILFSFRFKLDNTDKILIAFFLACFILMTLFRGLDNFAYYLPEDYYTFELSNFNNLNLCMNIPSCFFVILFISFIFQNEFYHCNLEVFRGLFPISALILYRILYGCLFGCFLICLDFIRDIFLYENLPVFSYSIHSLLCIVTSNIIGVIFNFVFKNVYVKVVLNFVLNILRLILAQRVLQVTWIEKENFSILFEKFYYIICNLLDVGLTNYNTFAGDIRKSIFNSSETNWKNLNFYYLNYYYPFMYNDEYIYISSYIILIFNILSLVYLSMFLHKRFIYFYNGL